MPATISAMSWACSWPGRQPISCAAARPSAFTYGLRRTSVLAALANAILLLVSVGAIAWEAIRRLANPRRSLGLTMIWVAAAGVVVNGVTAWMFVARPERRSQYSRRFPSHGGRRRGLRRRGRWRDSSFFAPAGRCSIRSAASSSSSIILRRHLGTVARFDQSRARRRPARDRSGRGEGFSRATSRGRRDPSPPRLGLEHDRDRLHRACREARTAAR